MEVAESNPTWGEERIAGELLLKLGIRVSPRTVRRYMPDGPDRAGVPSSRHWMTFVRNHAQAILACDFFVSVTATFRILYVLVVMEIGTPGLFTSMALSIPRRSGPSNNSERSSLGSSHIVF